MNSSIVMSRIFPSNGIHKCRLLYTRIIWANGGRDRTIVRVREFVDGKNGERDVIETETEEREGEQAKFESGLCVCVCASEVK